jgi:hypothetical protein
LILERNHRKNPENPSNLRYPGFWLRWYSNCF